MHQSQSREELPFGVRDGLGVARGARTDFDAVRPLPFPVDGAAPVPPVEGRGADPLAGLGAFGAVTPRGAGAWGARAGFDCALVGVPVDRCGIDVGR